MDMYDKLGLTVGRCEGRFGIEIEVEGDFLPSPDGEGHLIGHTWAVEEDNSLRGSESAEYVLTAPVSLYGARKALDVLGAAFEEAGSSVDEAVRAGVHVHLNIQTYTPLELMTLATTYYILEDLFVHWAGKTRVGNHFCLRALDAPYVIEKLKDACKKKDFRYVNTDNVRYASLNWNSMFKYGSIEFRAMRSTANLDSIYCWIEMIDQLTKGAAKFATPKAVVNGMSEMDGPQRFIEYVMGDYAKEFEGFKGVSIKNGMRVVQPLAQMINWQDFNKEKVNPFL
jgi:hypothetical protein